VTHDKMTNGEVGVSENSFVTSSYLSFSYFDPCPYTTGFFFFFFFFVSFFFFFLQFVVMMILLHKRNIYL